MSGTLQTLLVKINGDSSGLRRELGNVEGSAQRSGNVLKTALGTGLGFVGASVAMKGFGMATDFAGEALIGYNARMEQAQIGFTTLLGSSQKASAFIKDLQTFAAKTPFDFPGLQKSANTMLAMGFNAKDILPTLTSVGDAVAALGLGSEAVDRATYALGQMRSAGRVNAQDMMQLTSLGIPAWQLLADAMGKTVPEVRALSEKGLIPAQKGIDAIVKGIEKGNMGGMMAAQATTFNGALSTIQDTIMQLLSGALTPLFVQISKVVVAFSQWVQTPGATAFFKSIGDAISTVVGLISGLVTSAQSLFSTFNGGTASISGIVGQFSNLQDAVQGMYQKVLDAFFDIVDRVVPAFVQGFNNVTAQLPQIMTGLQTIILNGIQNIVTNFMTIGTRIADVIQANAPAFTAALGNFLQTGFDWLINTGVPMAAAAIGPLSLKFIDWVFATLPKLLDALNMLMGVIIDFIIRNAPVLAGKLVEWALAFAGFIVKDVLPRLIANLPTIAATILLFIGGAAPKILGKMGELGLGMVARLIGFLKTLPGKVGGEMGNVLARVVNAIPGIVNAAINLGKQLVSGAINQVMQLPFQVGKALANLVSTIGSWVGRIVNAAVQMAKGFVQGFIDALGSLPGKIAGAIASAFRSIHLDIGPFHISASGVSIDLPHIDIPHFQTGAWNIPRAMPGLLHPGEMVVPAGPADALRQLIQDSQHGGRIGTASMVAPVAATQAQTSPVIVNFNGDVVLGSRGDIDYLTEQIGRAVRLRK